MTTLVTGATGVLGSAVIDLLRERRQPVRALAMPGDDVSRLERDGGGGGEVDLCRGDLRDPASLRRALRGVDRVLHCAARTGPWGPAHEYDAVNVVGLRDLIDAALVEGVRRFVHVSSHTVHGNDLRGAGDETSPLRADPNPYSRSKLAGERIVARAVRERGAPVIVVRPGWIYGAGLPAFGRVVETVRRGGMVQIGDGENQLPLIEIRDVARGVLLAAEAPRTAAGSAYLLVNDEPVTQRRYLAAIARELGVAPVRRRMPYRLAIGLAALAEAAQATLRPERPPPFTRFGVALLGGDSRYSIRRARIELGFAPEVGIDEGVRRGVAWHLGAQPVDDRSKERAS